MAAAAFYAYMGVQIVFNLYMVRVDLVKSKAI